jgi:hypothetical protein
MFYFTLRLTEQCGEYDKKRWKQNQRYLQEFNGSQRLGAFQTDFLRIVRRNIWTDASLLRDLSFLLRATIKAESTLNLCPKRGDTFLEIGARGKTV